MWDKKTPSRRDFLTLAAGAFAVTAMPIAARARVRMHSRSLPVMGTIAELSVLYRDERHAQAAMSAALGELKRVERLMSRFDPASDIARANAAAGAQRVRISGETTTVIAGALAWANATGGGFDPAIARVVDLWDVKHRHTPPAPEHVQRLAGRQLYRRIDLDEGAVMVKEPDAAIDLGGIACGYGVDCAVQVLRDWGIANGFVNVGGDIYALGHAADGEAWRVGVRSAEDENVMIANVAISDAAIATSGDYEQGYTYRGRRYHHIMDPNSAEPRRTEQHTVTVVADKCIDADAASTAVFGMSQQHAQRLLALRAPGARIVSIG